MLVEDRYYYSGARTRFEAVRNQLFNLKMSSLLNNSSLQKLLILPTSKYFNIDNRLYHDARQYQTTLKP